MPSSLQILIAEDDPDDLRLIKAAIMELNPSVSPVTFKNAVLAINYLSACPDTDLPHLIVLDYNMPALNGAEAIIRMNESERLVNIPKVIVSTSNTPTYIEESLKAGATDYLIKPMHLSGLRQMAQKLLGYCNTGE
jgi:CheY-like chemotaxis protein